MSDMEKRLMQFLEHSPNDAMALLSLANIRKRQGKADEAAQLLERAVAAEPEYRSAHALLGEVLETRGDIDRARQSYERAYELARIDGDETMQAEMQERLAGMEEDI